MSIDKEIENLKLLQKIGLAPTTKENNHLSVEADLKYFKDTFQCIVALVHNKEEQENLHATVQELCRWAPLLLEENEVHGFYALRALSLTNVLLEELPDIMGDDLFHYLGMIKQKYSLHARGDWIKHAESFGYNI